MRKILISIVALLFLFSLNLGAQELVTTFGQEIQWQDIADGKEPDGQLIKWFQVNTEPDTWRVEGDILIDSGLPIGVIRSEKEYENFIMHIEWRHMEAGGNSGTFVWSKAEPGKTGSRMAWKFRCWNLTGLI